MVYEYPRATNIILSPSTKLNSVFLNNFFPTIFTIILISLEFGENGKNNGEYGKLSEMLVTDWEVDLVAEKIK